MIYSIFFKDFSFSLIICISRLTVLAEMLITFAVLRIFNA